METILLTHAYRLLSRRPQSEKEVRDKLTRFVYRRKMGDCSREIEQVVEQLKQDKYVNDTAFATWFIEQRLSFKPRSKRMLSSELAQRGVAEEIIEDVLQEYDEASALKQVIKKNKHLSKQKRVDFLLKHGFPYELVRELL